MGENANGYILFCFFLFFSFFNKSVGTAVLKGGKPLNVSEQNVPKPKARKQHVPQQNATCRSRDICKKVTSLSSTIGAQSED